MRELRCKKCNKVIAKVKDTSDRAYGETIIEIKCKCGYYNKIELH